MPLDVNGGNMMKKLISLIGTALLIVSLTACGTSSSQDKVPVSSEPKEEAKKVNANNVPVEIEKEILQVIKADVEATNSRDIEKVMKNFSSENQTEEVRQYTKDSLASFENIKLTLENKDTEVIYLKGKEALVKTTLEKRTPEFDATNNWQSNISVIHVLVKEEDGWKLSGSYATKNVFLKEDGTLDVNNELFTGTDDTAKWDGYIKEIKDQNLVPSEYLNEKGF